MSISRRPALLAGLVALSIATPAAAQAPAGGSAEANYKQTCQPCHMANGAAAMKAMNFADGEWKHGTSVKDLAKVIAEGVPGTAMMPFKNRFTEQEITELAKYVRTFDKSLKPEAGATPKKK